MGAVIAIAVIGVVALLASALWADRRYRAFERLPTHFDIRGRADAFGPRSVIIWIVPLTLVLALAAIAATMVLVPRELQNGNPLVGMAVAAAAVVAAQGFILWLLERWAVQQERR